MYRGCHKRGRPQTWSNATNVVDFSGVLNFRLGATNVVDVFQVLDEVIRFKSSRCNLSVIVGCHLSPQMQLKFLIYPDLFEDLSGMLDFCFNLVFWRVLKNIMINHDTILWLNKNNNYSVLGKIRSWKFRIH